jgi:hypothetical protein
LDQETRDAIQKEIGTLEKAIEEAPSGSRDAIHGKTMLEILKASSPGEPISKVTYFGMLDDMTEEHDPFLHRPLFVLCSHQEAREILQRGPPVIPVIVPTEFNVDKPVVSEEDFLCHLQTKDFVDVHIYNEEGSNASNLVPKRLPASEVVSMIRNPNCRLNLLSLDVYRQNPIPTALAGLREYRLLYDIEPHNDSKKPERWLRSGLRGCRTFAIHGFNSYSLCHWDHHGVMTTVFIEIGNKLWPTWPRMRPNDYMSWGKEEKYHTMPGLRVELDKDGHLLKKDILIPPFAPYLKNGYLLIQPQKTVHSPGCGPTAHGTGTMSWHESCMCDIVDQSLFERTYPAVTNEAPAKDFRFYLDKVLHLWENGLGGLNFGDEQEMQRFIELCEVNSR